MKKSIFFFILLFFFSILNSYSETAEPYKEDEFPEVLKDLRRAEIITLGAMPFVTFNATLGYSFGKFAAHDFDSSYFVNPFSDDSTFSKDEQVGIILTSLGVSVGIGLTDFVVHQIKRRNKIRKIKKQKNNEIQIFPVTEDKDAQHVAPPSEEMVHEIPAEEML